MLGAVSEDVIFCAQLGAGPASRFLDKFARGVRPATELLFWAEETSTVLGGLWEKILLRNMARQESVSERVLSRCEESPGRGGVMATARWR